MTDTNSTTKFREVSSYNGLDRTALYLGVPLLWAVLLLVLSVFIMFVGLYFFGIIGFLFVVILFPIAFFVRQISETDDKALDILKIELLYRAKRKAYHEFGNTLTFLPERYLRYEKTIEQQFTDIE